MPGSLHTHEEDDPNAPSPENESEASHWSEEMEAYDPYVGASEPGFDSFFDGLGKPLANPALPVMLTASK